MSGDATTTGIGLCTSNWPIWLTAAAETIHQPSQAPPTYGRRRSFRLSITVMEGTTRAAAMHYSQRAFQHFLPACAQRSVLVRTSFATSVK